MDFDVSVFIITDDRQYIPADEYDRELDGKGVFVLLTNDELDSEFGDDNSICIYGKWLDAMNEAKDDLSDRVVFTNCTDSVMCPWQIENKGIPGTPKLNLLNIADLTSWERHARRCLDGHRTNQEILAGVVSLLGDVTLQEYLPAIMVAHDTVVEFGGKTIRGFLPAIGQLQYIDANIKEVNDALLKMGPFEPFSACNDTMTGYWWSATEFTADTAWLLHQGEVCGCDKTDNREVLPLFMI